MKNNSGNEVILCAVENSSQGGCDLLDIVAVLTYQNDYTKNRNYWKYLKAKLKKEGSQLVSATTQLKLLAPDGKKRLSDMLDKYFSPAIFNFE